MSAARKTELRTYFARTLDDQYDTDEITTWINDVGQIMGKQDIIDDAQNVATYLMEEKGYQTGEEFVMMEQGDLEEGRSINGWALSDVSIRTLWRYFTSRYEIPVENNETSINGNTTTTNISGGISTGAEHALLKIANATGQKLPEYKEKIVKVKLVTAHIKAYANAKKNEWEGSGMYEAMILISKNGHLKIEDNMAAAQDKLNTVELDTSECADFKNSISEAVQQQAEIEGMDSILELAATLTNITKTRLYTPLNMPPRLAY